jgi:hypothetical protein
VRANKQIARLTAERHFEPGDEQKLEWPVSRLVFEIGEELTEFGNRTGFVGFHALNESDHVLRNQAGPRLTMPVDTVVSATNTPTFCNSIAPGSVVSTED